MKDADNSCCPNTDSKNIVAINKIYQEQYKEMGEPCAENVFCPEIVVGHSKNPTCVDNKCTSAEQ